MATFFYRHPKTGELYERVAPCGEAPKEIVLEDGTACGRCLAAEISSQGGNSPSCWPMKSRALAVHPTQRQEYMEFASKHGVPTHFDKMGHPVFQSRNHRRRYCDLIGAADFDGGYGDPQGQK